MNRLLARPDFDSTSASPETRDVPLDYRGALREILKESGMTLQQLDAVLEQVADLRGDSQEHLRFDEIQELEALPRERLTHLEKCGYCRELVGCCCDQEFVQQLVREAVRSSATKRSQPIHHRFISRMVVGAAALALLLVFPMGKLYSSHETKKTMQDLYRRELTGLIIVDSGDDFKAARLYFELNLPGHARTSFFKALRDGSVPHEQIVKLQNITLEAENKGWLERTTAKTEVMLQNRLGAAEPKSADDYLQIADLQLTAGKSTVGYIYLLKYLESVDVKPAASKEFTEPPLAMSDR